MSYKQEVQRGMDLFAEQSNSIFIGQAVEYKGTALTHQVKSFDSYKLLELPVAEEMQMGITTGLALNGSIPVSIFPRWNFLILAMNQLINHLDKIKIMSNN